MSIGNGLAKRSVVHNRALNRLKIRAQRILARMVELVTAILRNSVAVVAGDSLEMVVPLRVAGFQNYS